VQPFIENALVHGLLHKEGHKSLRVEFTIEDHLICSVTDNGVGRKRSKEIKKRQGAQHRSFAIDAITKRLAILTTKYGNEVGFVIYDLYENGKASGTTVRITMPFKESSE
jgi:sensor histidine kinase YesM